MNYYYDDDTTQRLILALLLLLIGFGAFGLLIQDAPPAPLPIVALPPYLAVSAPLLPINPPEELPTRPCVADRGITGEWTVCR